MSNETPRGPERTPPEVLLGGEKFDPDLYKKDTVIAVHHDGVWQPAKILTPTDKIGVVHDRLVLDLEINGARVPKKELRYVPTVIASKGEKFDNDKFEVADAKLSSNGEVEYDIAEDVGGTKEVVAKRMPQEMIDLWKRVEALRTRYESAVGGMTAVTHAKTSGLHKRRAEARKLLLEARKSLPVDRKRTKGFDIEAITSRFDELHTQADAAIKEFEEKLKEQKEKSDKRAGTKAEQLPVREKIDYKHFKRTKAEIDEEVEAARDATGIDAARTKKEDRERDYEALKTKIMENLRVAKEKAGVDFPQEYDDAEKAVEDAKNDLEATKRADEAAEKAGEPLRELAKAIQEKIETQLQVHIDREIASKVEERRKAEEDRYKTEKAEYDTKWTAYQSRLKQFNELDRNQRQGAIKPQPPEKVVPIDSRKWQLSAEEKANLTQNAKEIFLGDIVKGLRKGRNPEKDALKAEIDARRKARASKNTDAAIRMRGDDFAEATYREFVNGEVLQEIVDEFAQHFVPEATRKAEAVLRDAEQKLRDIKVEDPEIPAKDAALLKNAERLMKIAQDEFAEKEKEADAAEKTIRDKYAAETFPDGEPVFDFEAEAKEIVHRFNNDILGKCYDAKGKPVPHIIAGLHAAGVLESNLREMQRGFDADLLGELATYQKAQAYVTNKGGNWEFRSPFGAWYAIGPSDLVAERNFLDGRSDVCQGMQQDFDAVANIIAEAEFEKEKADKAKAAQDASKDTKDNADKAVRDAEAQYTKEKDLERKSATAEARESRLYDMPPSAIAEVLTAQGRWGEVVHMMRTLFESGGAADRALAERFKQLFDKASPPSPDILKRLGIDDWEEFVDLWQERIAGKVAEQMSKQAEAKMKQEVARQVTALQKAKKNWLTIAGRVGLTVGLVAGGAALVSTGVGAIAAYAGVTGTAAAVAGSAGTVAGATAGGALRGVKWMQKLQGAIFGGREKRKEAELEKESREKFVNTMLEDMFGAGAAGVQQGDHFASAQVQHEGNALFTAVLSEVTRQETFRQAAAEGNVPVSQEDARLIAEVGGLGVNEALVYKAVVEAMEPPSAENREQRVEQKKELARVLRSMSERTDKLTERLVRQSDPKAIQVLDNVIKAHTGKSELGWKGSALTGAILGSLYEVGRWLPPEGTFGVKDVVRGGTAFAFGFASGWKSGEAGYWRGVYDKERPQLEERMQLLEGINKNVLEGTLRGGLEDVAFNNRRQDVIHLKRLLHGTASKEQMAAVIGYDEQGNPLADELLLDRIRSVVREAERSGLMREKAEERQNMEAVLERMQKNSKAVQEQQASAKFGPVWAKLWRGAAWGAGSAAAAVLMGKGFDAWRESRAADAAAAARDAGTDAATPDAPPTPVPAGGAPVPGGAPPDWDALRDKAGKLWDSLFDKDGAPGPGADPTADSGAMSVETAPPESVVAGTYTIGKGEGFLHTFNDFQGDHKAELLEGIRANKEDWVDKLTERGQKVYGYQGQELQDYVDKKLIHNWRVEQIQKGLFGVDIRPGEQGQNTFHYTKTPHVGAKVEFVKNANGYFEARLAEEGNDGLVSSHAEKVIPIAPEAGPALPGGEGFSDWQTSQGPALPHEINGQTYYALGGKLTDGSEVALLYDDLGVRVGFYDANGQPQLFQEPSNGWPGGAPEEIRIPQGPSVEELRAQARELHGAGGGGAAAEEGAGGYAATRMGINGGPVETWNVPRGPIKEGTMIWRRADSGEFQVMEWGGDVSQGGSGQWESVSMDKIRADAAAAREALAAERALESTKAMAEHAGATAGDVNFNTMRTLQTKYDLSLGQIRQLEQQGFLKLEPKPGEEFGPVLVRDRLGEVSELGKSGEAAPVNTVGEREQAAAEARVEEAEAEQRRLQREIEEARRADAAEQEARPAIGSAKEALQQFVKGGGTVEGLRAAVDAQGGRLETDAGVYRLGAGNQLVFENSIGSAPVTSSNVEALRSMHQILETPGGAVNQRDGLIHAYDTIFGGNEPAAPPADAPPQAEGAAAPSVEPGGDAQTVDTETAELQRFYESTVSRHGTALAFNEMVQRGRVDIALPGVNVTPEMQQEIDTAIKEFRSGYTTGNEDVKARLKADLAEKVEAWKAGKSVAGEQELARAG